MPQTLTRVPALAAPIVPSLMERGTYDVSAEVRNQLLPIANRASVDVALFPAGLRAGTMTLVFATKEAAYAAFVAHQLAAVWTLTDDDIPEASMQYVVIGTLRIYLDPQGSNSWLVLIGFQETA